MATRIKVEGFISDRERDLLDDLFPGVPLDFSEANAGGTGDGNPCFDLGESTSIEGVQSALGNSTSEKVARISHHGTENAMYIGTSGGDNATWYIYNSVRKQIIEGPEIVIIEIMSDRNNLRSGWNALDFFFGGEHRFSQEAAEEMLEQLTVYKYKSPAEYKDFMMRKGFDIRKCPD